MKLVIALTAVLWLTSTVNHVAGQITRAQLAQHSTSSDCWTAIGGKVYNLSSFVPSHPNTQLLVLCGVDGMLCTTNCAAGWVKKNSYDKDLVVPNAA